MKSLPTVDFFGHEVSRLICGGNPFSGFSHQTSEISREMIEYYTMPRLQKCLDECWRNGVNTIQNRGDRHIMRMYLEHRLAGGKLQWIAQVASEFKSLEANINEICRYEPIAIYHHGTHVDNLWHDGRIDEVRDIVKMIKDHGLPAGVCSHIPEVIEYCEEHDWENDFYMACFYNLARKQKAYQATAAGKNFEESYPREDRDRMTATIRQVRKPCLGFKIMAAGRNCATPGDVRAAIEYAFENIKPTDCVVVGHFQKHSNQVAENAQMVREVLGSE